MLEIDHIDHFVIPCSDVETICDFYVRVLNMRRIDFGNGRVALGFGKQKINLQPAGWEEVMRAQNHIEGTADFCLITETPWRRCWPISKFAGSRWRRNPASATARSDR